jgi:hypothetical protein
MGTAGAPTAAASHGAIALSRSPGHCQWHPGQPETRPGARSVTVGSLSPRLGRDAEACSGHASRRPRRAGPLDQSLLGPLGPHRVATQRRVEAGSRGGLSAKPGRWAFGLAGGSDSDQARWRPASALHGALH